MLIGSYRLQRNDSELLVLAAVAAIYSLRFEM